MTGRALETRCPECGALLESGRACREYFDELLAVEWQIPGGPGKRAHFLVVASYHLQHPFLLAPAAVVALRRTFADVIAGQASIADALVRAGVATDGPTRVRRRSSEPMTRPANWPMHWQMTVRDVCGVPISRYLEQVEAWATSVDSSLP